jgi:hypothetical protein
MSCFICNKEAKVERENIYTTKYTCGDCGLYYTELAFTYQLEKFKNLYGPEKYQGLLDIMKEKTQKNVIVFTFDFTETFTDIEGAVYVEIEDLTNKLGTIFVDVNNRGSRHL